MTNQPDSRTSETKDEVVQQAERLTEHTRDQADRVKDDVLGGAQAVAQTAGEEAKSVAHDAREEVRHLVDSGLAEANTQAGAGQQRIAGYLHEVADELAGMAAGGERSGLATHAVRELSDRGRNVADWLERREPRDVMNEVRRYAARNPWTFLALSAGAGLLAGRFMRGVRDNESHDNTATPRRSVAERSVGGDHAAPSEGLGQVPPGIGHGGAGHGETFSDSPINPPLRGAGD